MSMIDILFLKVPKKVMTWWWIIIKIIAAFIFIACPRLKSFLMCCTFEVNEWLLFFKLNTKRLLYWEITLLQREPMSPFTSKGHESFRITLFFSLFYQADITAIRKLIFCRLDTTFDTAMTNLINTVFMHVTVSVAHSECVDKSAKRE